MRRFEELESTPLLERDAAVGELDLLVDVGEPFLSTGSPILIMAKFQFQLSDLVLGRTESRNEG